MGERNEFHPNLSRLIKLARPQPPKVEGESTTLASEKTRASLSGLEFRVISHEISSAVKGSYVSNIYSVGESQLFRFRRSGGEESETGATSVETTLVLSPRFGAWITEKPARVETTEFTTALRGSLLRAKLASVSQYDLDRVLIMRFEGRGERLQLVLEMMPPGNLLLTGPDEKIVLLLREVKTGTRRLARGLPYVPPAQTRASLESLTTEDIRSALANEKTMGRALGRGLSIPRRYIDEILARLSHRQDDPADVSEPEIERITATIRELLATIESKPRPCLVKTEEGGVEVMVVEPRSREVVETSPTLSPLLDKLFLPAILSGEGAATGKEEIEVHARRALELRSTIADLQSKKEGLLRLSAQLRDLAALVRNAPDVEQAVNLARAAPNVPSDLLPRLEASARGGQASVSSAIFDRAKRAEREASEIDSAVDLLRSKLEKESVKSEARKARAIPLSKRRKEWYEKFRWFYTTEGKLAIGGRDAQSNTTLIRKHLQGDDTVYHADLFGSPFFVLKGGREQKEEEVRQVARATVTFSSAWKTGLGAADAYWVAPDQVSAAAPTGEYLAHGSFAIKGKKNFVTKNPVEVAVGLDDNGRIVSGPEEAIMKVAGAYVTIVPSKEKSSDTAKKVLHELRQHAGPDVSLSVDDVLRMLPTGGGKIVRRRAERR